MIQFLITSAIMSYPIAFVMKLIYGLKIYKLLGDYGYKTNFKNCQIILDEATKKYDSNFCSIAVPFYNIYDILKSGLDLSYFDNFILDDYERQHIIEKMSLDEKKEYTKNPTGIKSLLIGLNFDNKDIKRFWIDVLVNDNVFRVLVEHNLVNKSIRLVKIKGKSKSEISIYEKDIIDKIEKYLGLKQPILLEEEKPIEVSNNLINEDIYDYKRAQLEVRKKYYERLIEMITSTERVNYTKSNNKIIKKTLIGGRR